MGGIEGYTVGAVRVSYLCPRCGQAVELLRACPACYPGEWGSRIVTFERVRDDVIYQYERDEPEIRPEVADD